MSKMEKVSGNSQASTLWVTKAASKATHTSRASRKEASSDWNLKLLRNIIRRRITSGAGATN
jgi:hypothetical protein